MSTKGSNTWTWDGTDSSGNTLPDGSYKVAVTGANADGTTSALPFSVVGTATGVLNQSNSIQLQLGALSVDFSQGAVGGELKASHGPMRIDAGWPPDLNRLPVLVTLVPSTFRMEKS